MFRFSLRTALIISTIAPALLSLLALYPRFDRYLQIQELIRLCDDHVSLSKQDRLLVRHLLQCNDFLGSELAQELGVHIVRIHTYGDAAEHKAIIPCFRTACCAITKDRTHIYVLEQSDSALVGDPIETSLARRVFIVVIDDETHTVQWVRLPGICRGANDVVIDTSGKIAVVVQTINGPDKWIASYRGGKLLLK